MRHCRDDRALIRRTAAGFFVLVIANAWASGCSLDGLSGGVRPSDGGDTPPIEAGPVGPDAAAADAADAGGCPGCVTLVSGEAHPTELVLGGDRLFWLRSVDVGAVVSSQLDGKDVTFEGEHAIANPHDLVLVAPGPQAFAISADGTMDRYLVFSTCNDSSGVERLASLGDSLVSVKSTGLYSGDCGTSVLQTSESGISAVAGDAPFAWYAAGGQIIRCDVSATRCNATRSVLATGQTGVATLARDDTRVFWISGGQIHARAKSALGDAGAPDLVASGTHPQALAPAGTDLYWTDLEDGTVVDTALATSTSSRIVARGLSRPWGIAVDDSFVYVAESAAGRIVRIPR
jgi:hypothetical protein